MADCRELLGRAEAGSGNADRAIDYLKQALTTSSEAARPEILIELGNLLAPVNQTGESERYLDEALRLVSPNSDSNSLILRGETYLALANLYAMQGQSAKAIKTYAQAIDNFKIGSQNDMVIAKIRALNGLALELRDTDIDSARARVFESANLTDRYIDTAFSQLSFAEQCAFLQVANEERSALMTVCGETPYLPEAYKYVAKWRGLLIESLRRQAAIDAAVEKDSKLKSLADDLTDKRRKLSTLSRQNADDGSREVYKHAEHEVEQAEDLLAGAADVWVSDPISGMGTAAICAKLKPDEAFVDIVYLRGSKSRPERVAAVVL
ncbi:MAG: tetratricopeptide repeat protein, partial [Terriglobales bacterium]